MWTENPMDRPYHHSTLKIWKLWLVSVLSDSDMHSFVYESTHVTYERRSKLKRFFSPRVNRLRAVPLHSVEYKLGRTGESELAERETSLRSIFSLAWPSWGTACSYPANNPANGVSFDLPRKVGKDRSDSASRVACSLPSQQKANAATALSKTRTSKIHIWSKKPGFLTIFSISLIARVGLKYVQNGMEWLPSKHLPVLNHCYLYR